MKNKWQVICPNCGEFIDDGKAYCYLCGTLICDKCNNMLSKNDSFCGNCGNDVKELIKNSLKEIKERREEQEKIKREKEELKKKKDLEKEKAEFASNLIIECEGNKFKAIKNFKEKYKVDNAEATDFINKAYDEINDKKSSPEVEKKETKKPSIEDILEKCGYSELASIKETMNVYGYDLATAKSYVDEAIRNMKKNNSYVDPNGIKKTIIVSQSSRKSATSAIGRGLIGSAILGPVGLLAGASAKSKEKTTFQVIYNNGKQDTVTVSNDSWAFRKYCKFLDN